MLLSHLFPLILIVAVSSPESQEPSEIVQAFVDGFKKIAEPKINKTEKINIIKKTATAFRNITQQLERLLKSSKNFINQEVSTEDKTQEKLYQDVNYQFSRQDQRIGENFNVLFLNILMSEWETKVILYLMNVDDVTELFSDPRLTKHEVYIRSLLNMCQLESSGLNGMANYIHYRSAVGCILQTPFGVQQHHSCLTDAVVYGHKFDWRRIEHHAATVQIYLAKLLVAGDFCSKYMDPNSSTSNDYFLDKLGGKLAETSAFLLDYVPKKLNTSAKYEEFVASNIINEYPGTGSIPIDDYQKLATLIAVSLKHIGSRTQTKQILITPSDNTDSTYSTFFVCPEYWCSLIRNQRGVNVMITRFNNLDIPNSRAFQHRISEVEAPIKELMKVDYSIDLDDLVLDMESKKKNFLLFPVTLVALPKLDFLHCVSSTSVVRFF